MGFINQVTIVARLINPIETVPRYQYDMMIFYSIVTVLYTYYVFSSDSCSSQKVTQ